MSTSKNLAKLMAVALSIIFVGGAVAPTATFAQSDKSKARQKDKNLMRNLGIGAGAGAIYEGLHGRTTNAVVLGAGAALAGKKYEDSRKAQAREAPVRKVYRWRNGKRVGYTKYVGKKRIGYYNLRG